VDILPAASGRRDIFNVQQTLSWALWMTGQDKTDQTRPRRRVAGIMYLSPTILPNITPEVRFHGQDHDTLGLAVPTFPTPKANVALT
jgi:hypothetical protein